MEIVTSLVSGVALNQILMITNIMSYSIIVYIGSYQANLESANVLNFFEDIFIVFYMLGQT